MSEKAILFDTSKCSACKGCQVACKCWNDLPSPTGLNENVFSGTYQNPVDLNGDTRLIITFSEHESGVSTKPIEWAFTRRACMHCTDAGCVSVCPPGALAKDPETGFVSVDESKCIRCHYCRDACPFDVPRYYGEAGGTINKCTACLDRVENGMAPACVSTCSPGALQFGDRSEMIALANESVAALKERGFADACVYGETEMGGTHVIMVLKYGPEKHGLPVNPQVNPLVSLTEIIKPVTGIGMGAVAVGLAACFASGIGYHRDTMRYDEKTGDKIDVDTGEVVAHTDLATHVTTHTAGDEAGIHWGGHKKGGE